MPLNPSATAFVPSALKPNARVPSEQDPPVLPSLEEILDLAADSRLNDGLYHLYDGLSEKESTELCRQLANYAKQLLKRSQRVIGTLTAANRYGWLSPDLRDALVSVWQQTSNFRPACDRLSDFVENDIFQMAHHAWQSPDVFAIVRQCECMCALTQLLEQVSEGLPHWEEVIQPLDAQIKSELVAELTRLCEERQRQSRVRLPDSVPEEHRGGLPTTFALAEALRAAEQGDSTRLEALATFMGLGCCDDVQQLAHCVVSFCAPAVLSPDESLTQIHLCELLGRLLAWLQASQLRIMKRNKDANGLVSSVADMMVVYWALCPQSTRSEEDVSGIIAKVSAEWSTFAQRTPFAYLTLNDLLRISEQMPSVLGRMVSVTDMVNREPGCADFTPSNHIGWLSRLSAEDPDFAALIAVTLSVIFRTGTTEMPICHIDDHTVIAPPRAWFELLFAATFAAQVCHERNREGSENPLTFRAVRTAVESCGDHSAFADAGPYRHQASVFAWFLLAPMQNDAIPNPLLSNYPLMDNMSRPRPSAPSLEVVIEQQRSSATSTPSPPPTSPAVEDMSRLVESPSEPLVRTTPLPEATVHCTANPVLDGSTPHRVAVFPPVTVTVSASDPPTMPRNFRRPPQPSHRDGNTLQRQQPPQPQRDGNTSHRPLRGGRTPQRQQPPQPSQSSHRDGNTSHRPLRGGRPPRQ